MEDSDDSSVEGFTVDLTGVNFDTFESTWTPEEQELLDWEGSVPFEVTPTPALALSEALANGQYDQVLRSKEFTEILPNETIPEAIARQIDPTSLVDCIEWECVGIAAYSLFLQNNYTGPAMEPDQLKLLQDINPHAPFREYLQYESETGEQTRVTSTDKTSKYQNKVLAELAVDGEWPCQVSNVPYFLLLARSIFCALVGQSYTYKPDQSPIQCRFPLKGLVVWHARCILAHHRLLQSREPSLSLWNQIEEAFEKAKSFYCQDAQVGNKQASNVMLEYGLAEHHFDRNKKGIKSFRRAQTLSGLSVVMTGAEGVRTKYQKKKTAQLRVDAVPRDASNLPKEGPEFAKIKDQMIPHPEDEILLEEVKYDDEDTNKKERLPILDQCILLSLCLDVKNTNAMDGLTAEEMGAFLARVLEHHDDWMVYSSGLLERAWLEFERSHARERAILQLQALLDQHTNRLTLTQSTRKSIEESAPVQDRLKNLHILVYPPRWSMIHDLADRYASIGVVTSAAELYSEIELWDYVVECYKRAGRVAKAEQIVREQLEVQETPRMWNALGSLTNNPKCYEKAIELSNGRFSNAFVSLAEYHFENGNLEEAAENYSKSLKIKPLAPRVWFRAGTIYMQLEKWDGALVAFTNVVQQEPEEADAWANVAAIHLQNKQPSEAYPALNESLRYNRNNWRVWTSKLYTCLDLSKFNESIQAINMILDLTKDKKMDPGTRIDPRCVRGLIGGVLKELKDNAQDSIALESTKRTVERLHTLLERLASDLHNEAWTHESLSFFYDHIGNEEELLESLQREYKLLQATDGWETDKELISKICDVAFEMSRIHQKQNTKESLTKARFLIRGLLKKIELSLTDDTLLLREKFDALQTHYAELEAALSNL